MAGQWRYTPTLGARVLYAGKEWSVWCQGDVRDSWWLVRRDGPDAPQESVRVKSREIQPAGRTMGV